MRGIVIMLLLVLPVFGGGSQKKQVQKEQKILTAKDVQRARSLAIKVANKKYPDKMRRRLDAQASKLFKTMKVGEPLSVKIGSRMVSGKIREIGKRAIYIGDQEVHRMHFPSYLFDESATRAARKEYVESRFDKPRKECVDRLYSEALKLLANK